jgi:aquaporin Z
MTAGLFAEILLTFFFLMIILGATDKRAPRGLAPIAIGFGLTLIHLIGIPITNLSVNPRAARARQSWSEDGRCNNCGFSG